MSSLLYPFSLNKNIDNEETKVNTSLHDLQIEDIVRIVYADLSKQKKITSILEDICTDADTIKYRQSVLRDFMYNRSIFYGVGRECFNLDKCYNDYNAVRSARAKMKNKNDINLADASTTLKEYAHIMLNLLGIYRKMNEIFKTYGPTSQGLKELADKIKDHVDNPDFEKLEIEMRNIEKSAFAYAFSTDLDDRLIPSNTKYILASGKYQGEKISLFKKKTVELGKIELNDKVKIDFNRLVIDGYNNLVIVLEDIFESLYDNIYYVSEEYLFFEFAVTMYDILGERMIFCCFPDIDNYTEYKNAKDPYMTIRYINDGYSSTVYGNDISIQNKESLLVVGPNNTGKTVLLRTIGINQIFAQNGLYVIADKATISIKQKVITIFSGEEKDTDVGGRFEKEVIDIKNIIDIVDDKSLVIINEIFQSTFAADGEKALFDILNYFSEIDVTWVDVTHLLGILDDRKRFTHKVKTYETTSSENKFKINEI